MKQTDLLDRHAASQERLKKLELENFEKETCLVNSEAHFLKKLEDFVKKWNKIRNDNVVTKAPEVIAPEEPPEEASDEETNPLDEGVVV